MIVIVARTFSIFSSDSTVSDMYLHASARMSPSLRTRFRNAAGPHLAFFESSRAFGSVPDSIRQRSLSAPFLFRSSASGSALCESGVVL